jgi:hypothetical protein
MGYPPFMETPLFVSILEVWILMFKIYHHVLPTISSFLIPPPRLDGWIVLNTKHRQLLGCIQSLSPDSCHQRCIDHQSATGFLDPWGLLVPKINVTRYIICCLCPISGHHCKIYDTTDIIVCKVGYCGHIKLYTFPSYALRWSQNDALQQRNGFLVCEKSLCPGEYLTFPNRFMSFRFWCVNYSNLPKFESSFMILTCPR